MTVRDDQSASRAPHRPRRLRQRFDLQRSIFAAERLAHARAHDRDQYIDHPRRAASWCTPARLPRQRLQPPGQVRDGDQLLRLGRQTGDAASASMPSSRSSFSIRCWPRASRAPTTPRSMHSPTIVATPAWPATSPTSRSAAPTSGPRRVLTILAGLTSALTSRAERPVSQRVTRRSRAHGQASDLATGFVVIVPVAAPRRRPARRRCAMASCRDRRRWRVSPTCRPSCS